MDPTDPTLSQKHTSDWYVDSAFVMRRMLLSVQHRSDEGVGDIMAQVQSTVEVSCGRVDWWANVGDEAVPGEGPRVE
ncbi:hypothetical protein BV22DRAFT_1040722 [Leucogyrophana mollusca]|uniref:Uncharacterized protein n=1 Tax=Leucogyrophana mollusca TaxID=85980 RepID=A0ACB8B2X2_9AGAM|nr:hypothetical protein BV22DRAFT_1040722 [Leucogyrophana mollusca]